MKALKNCLIFVCAMFAFVIVECFSKAVMEVGQPIINMSLRGVKEVVPYVEIYWTGDKKIPNLDERIEDITIKMLIDAEAVRDAPTSRLMQKSLQMLSLFILKLMKEYYHEKRYFDILGKGGGYELEAFSNADLDGAFDVKLQAASTINASPAAKIETLWAAWDREVPQLAAQGDTAAIDAMVISEMGTIEDLTRKTRDQRNHAVWCLERMKEGETPPIFDAEDPRIHMDVFGEYIISLDFQELAKDEQDVFLQRYELYKQNLQQEQGGQAQAPPQEGAVPPPVDAMQQQMAMGMGGQGGVPPVAPVG